MASANDVIQSLKEQSIEFVDLKFIDFIGTWNHFQITAHSLDEACFEDGVAFDGSSIRAWQTIDTSDMYVVPDPNTAKVDPFFERPTLSLVCDIKDPITGEHYTRDPRNIGKKALMYLQSTGIADNAYFGPESEFFVFDSVVHDTHSGAGFYYLDSTEAPWGTGEEGGNMGYRVRPKGGYFPVKPVDQNQDLRNEMVVMLETMGISVERAHHEVAPSQHEINFKFDTLLNTADNLCWYKYIVKNVAKQHGKTATFMPKPVFNDNGNGMHTHQSLWKDGNPLFAGDQYAGLSETALFYIGGILKHARALAAFTNPSTNSYRRLLPGFEAPISLAYSNRNRSAAVRIPVVETPKAKRIEFRVPDSTSNPYLAFSAMLMAGLDGIQNKIHPGEPLEKDIYGLPAEELSKIPKMPSSLREALDELKADQQFLLQGDVFTPDVIEYWCNYKIEAEINEVDSRPSPHEFALYYDA